MPQRTPHRETLLKTIGVCSPYLSVIIGIFLLRNGFLAVLFYHLVLLFVIVKTNKSNALRSLCRGFHPIWGPLMGLGGLVPGIVILLLWPISKREHVDLFEILTMLNLKDGFFILFAIYACLVNPFLEELFWRGCFKNPTLWPNIIDILFAGYHALVVIPILKAPFVFLIFLAMVCVGWLFRILYRFNRGLLIPLMTHIVADIAILFAVWKIIRQL